MEKTELSNDFNHMPILGRHIRATNIDNFGKIEYIRVLDFKTYINRLKIIFCQCTPKVECFHCYKIKMMTGENLMEQEEKNGKGK